MKFSKIIAFVAIFMISFSVAQAKESIKIGVYLPLTGQNAFGGNLELEGIKLAHSIQAQVLNRDIELIILDNKSDKVEAANVVARLVDEKVSAIIGSYGSSLALAGGEVLEKAKIPAIATSPTSPLVTQNKKYYFRAGFIDPYQGKAAAQYAYRELGYRKAALLTDIASDYSVGLTSFFKRAFRKMGGEIVAEQRYASADKDFQKQLIEIMKSKADIVFMPAYYAEGSLILEQARQLGIELVFMGADAMDNPETLERNVYAIEGFLHTTFPYDVSMNIMNEEALRFTLAWNKMYPHKQPNVNSALGYSAYFLLIHAIEKARSSKTENITKALENIKKLPTVLGLVTINKGHDAEMPVGIIQYKNGKRNYLGSIEVE